MDIVLDKKKIKSMPDGPRAKKVEETYQKLLMQSIFMLSCTPEEFIESIRRTIEFLDDVNELFNTLPTTAQLTINTRITKIDFPTLRNTLIKRYIEIVGESETKLVEDMLAKLEEIKSNLVNSSKNGYSSYFTEFEQIKDTYAKVEKLVYSKTKLGEPYVYKYVHMSLVTTEQRTKLKDLQPKILSAIQDLNKSFSLTQDILAALGELSSDYFDKFLKNYVRVADLLKKELTAYNVNFVLDDFKVPMFARDVFLKEWKEKYDKYISKVVKGKSKNKKTTKKSTKGKTKKSYDLKKKGTTKKSTKSKPKKKSKPKSGKTSPKKTKGTTWGTSSRIKNFFKFIGSWFDEGEFFKAFFFITIFGGLLAADYFFMGVDHMLTAPMWLVKHHVPFYWTDFEIFESLDQLNVVINVICGIPNLFLGIWWAISRLVGVVFFALYFTMPLHWAVLAAVIFYHLWNDYNIKGPTLAVCIVYAALSIIIEYILLGVLGTFTSQIANAL